MAGTPTKIRRLDDFFDSIETEMRRKFGSERERIVQAVFGVIGDSIEPGEVRKLAKMFPDELRPLWRDEFYSV